MVKGNKSPTGNINKFELAAEYLTPWGSFTKNHNTNRKSDAAEISDASDRGKKVSATGGKQGKGSTGMEFCYYNYNELKYFSKEKRDDIFVWRKSQKNGGKFNKQDQVR